MHIKEIKVTRYPFLMGVLSLAQAYPDASITFSGTLDFLVGFVVLKAASNDKF